jgi:3-isopropylmalate dehydrogenase
VLVNAGAVWSRLVTRGGRRSSPTSTVDYLHVDAATIFLVTDPARFDVIVTDNLFGDIITDLAAAITGGIGLAASGNVNPDRTAPSMFEPVHGSAPDIAGQQKADPTAAILSTALMLRPGARRRGCPVERPWSPTSPRGTRHPVVTSESATRSPPE